MRPRTLDMKSPAICTSWSGNLGSRYGVPGSSPKLHHGLAGSIVALRVLLRVFEEAGDVGWCTNADA
jgi:hypothetical protein